jgi:alpha-amylase
MAYMNTIPGLPVIYYGSEFGMTGASDPDNRRMMRFDNNLSKYEKNTMEEVSKVIKLRGQHTALRYGDFYTLVADKNVYAYTRSDLNERLLIILNKSTRRNSTKIELPSVYRASKLVSLIDGKELKVKSNKATIKLDGQEYNIYQIQKMD